MNFKTIVQSYFKQLKEVYRTASLTGEATAELSYRPVLDEFLKNVISNIDPNIYSVFEPSSRGGVGRPDWSFSDHVTLGTYGFIEAKGLDPVNEIDVSAHFEQVNKYLTLGRPVILTDGIDFILFGSHEEIKKFSLCDKPINWETPSYNYDLEVLFNIFFSRIGSRIISEDQLVEELAKRTIPLSESLCELLELSTSEAADEYERTSIQLLKDLQVEAIINHDETLRDNSTFASFISQILSFGLLYAHRVLNRQELAPEDKYKRLHDFWFNVMQGQALNPFKSLVCDLNSELDNNRSKIGFWYNNIRQLLSYIHLSNDQIESPDYHVLYEKFLAVYDPDTRFDYGAFYTPRHLAFYIVKLVKHIFEISGLNFNDIENRQLKIIDPCCGTGTFIEAILSTYTLSEKSLIIGFEILPVPYALANYRMEMLQDMKDNVRLVLVNTLSNDTLLPETRNIIDQSNFFITEKHKAQEYSQPPITLIIGNPPCSSESRTNVHTIGSVLQGLMNDFRPSNRSARQNIQKQLSNDYMGFLRWSLEKAKQSTPSIFALILPSSFAANVSFKAAREFISNNTSELWVLEFDSDNRAGRGGANLFSTLQGRLILVGTLIDQDSKLNTLHYKNITSKSKAEKIDFLQNTPDTGCWEIINPSEPEYLFRPREQYDKDLYACFRPLIGKDGIFMRTCSGMKLSPVHLLVHRSKEILNRRTRYISDLRHSYNEIKREWYEGQAKPPMETKLTEAVRRQMTCDVVKKYAFRPYMSMYVNLTPRLLEKLVETKGGGMRRRPEIEAAYCDERVKGFTIAPAPGDLNASLHRFSSFCWGMPDNDLAYRGSSRLLCNYFPENKTKNWDPTPKCNINPELLVKLEAAFHIEESVLIDLVLFYSYATLSSNSYLNKFKSILHSTTGEYPCIPITADKELFQKLAELGKSLALLEREDDNSIERKDIDQEVTSFMYYNYNISEGQILFLSREREVIYAINDIPEQILNYKVAGYSIIEQHLKYYSYQYYRKEVGQKEIQAIISTLKRIEESIRTIKEIDGHIEEVFSMNLI